MNIIPDVPFRFLNLPLEIRTLIYQALFHNSSVVIVEISGARLNEFVDEFVQKADLTNYQPTITYTSRTIRHESVKLLETQQKLASWAVELRT